MALNKRRSYITFIVWNIRTRKIGIINGFVRHYGSLFINCYIYVVQYYTTVMCIMCINCIPKRLKNVNTIA